MISAVWFLAGAILSTVGIAAGVQRNLRGGGWFLLGCVGLGLYCVFLGFIGHSNPPLGSSPWIRPLWVTLLLTTPAWAAFSYRFGRPSTKAGASIEGIVVGSLWLSAAALLVLGSIRPPLEISASSGYFTLRPPVGRLITVHALISLIIVLRNIQATIEAARASSRKQTEHVLYALLPVTLAGIYLLADILLFGQQPRTRTLFLLPATLVSAVALAIALGQKRLSGASMPVGHPVIYSSAVLVAVGFLFVALALLAQGLNAIGISVTSSWFVWVAPLSLILILGLTLFPGIREQLRRFANRSLYISDVDNKSAWERLDKTLASVTTPDALAEALRQIFWSTIGPLRVRLWIADAIGSNLVPLGEGNVPIFGPDHPLVRTLQRRREPLLLTEPATRVDDIPLYVACEELGSRHGLRVFYRIGDGERLEGILGCGSGERGSLHPEDLDLIRVVADRLSGVLGRMSIRTPEDVT